MRKTKEKRNEEKARSEVIDCGILGSYVSSKGCNVLASCVLVSRTRRCQYRIVKKDFARIEPRAKFDLASSTASSSTLLQYNTPLLLTS